MVRMTAGSHEKVWGTWGTVLPFKVASFLKYPSYRLYLISHWHKALWNVCIILWVHFLKIITFLHSLSRALFLFHSSTCFPKTRQPRSPGLKVLIATAWSLFSFEFYFPVCLSENLTKCCFVMAMEDSFVTKSNLWLLHNCSCDRWGERILYLL